MKEKVLNLTSLLDKSKDLLNVIDFLLNYNPIKSSDLKTETEKEENLESKYFISFDKQK